MAAIAGLVGLRDAPFLRACCKKSLEAQRGYGSRLAGIRAFDGIALAYSPHSEDAHVDQPFVDDDRWLMAADARLANRSDLLARLGLRDDDRLSDAALLFRYWRRCGDEYLADVVGEFAIATYDRSRRT